MDSTVRFGLPLLIAGQGQKEITHNEALLLLDTMISCIVERRDLVAPPQSAAEGQCWIVPAGATLAWQGKTDQIAAWTAGGWRFLVPPEGTTAFVRIGRERLRRLEGVWRVEALSGAPTGAVPGPEGGSTIDSEARAVLDTLLDRMRALGLIEA
jgi:hypothetical protein